MEHFCGQMDTSFQGPLLMAGRLAMENTSTRMGTTTRGCSKLGSFMEKESTAGPMEPSMLELMTWIRELGSEQ